MSTKTSIKRIAAVAAVALTLGGFSAVTAHAAAVATATLQATAGYSNASAPSAGIAATANAVGDGNHYVTVVLTASTADRGYTVTTSGVGSIYGSATGATVVDAAVSVVNANGTNAAGGFSFGPTGTFPSITAFAGASTATFTVLSGASGTQTITATPINGTSAASTLTITWGAAPVLSVANSSIALVAVGANNAADIASFNSYTADPTSGVTGSSAIATGSVAIIRTLSLNNESTPAGLSGHTITAVVSGPGLLKTTSAVVDDTKTVTAAAVPAARAVTQTTGAKGAAFFYVLSDGTSGTSTITFSDGSTVLGTKSVTFYGTTPASLTVTANSTVAAAGATVGAAAASTAGSGAVTISAKDTNGNLVGGLNGNVGTSTGYWYATSSNTTCISSTIQSVVPADGSALADAVGAYEVNLTAATGATSGCSASVTFSYVASSTSTIVSAPVTFTVGGTTIASLALTTDAASYSPGDKVKLSLVAKDSSGNPVADGSYGIWYDKTTTLASTVSVAPLGVSAQLTSTPFGITGGSAGTTKEKYTFLNGVSSSTFYAPYTDGLVKLTSTLGDTNSGLAAALQDTTLAGSFSVSTGASTASQAAVDAANEATDAANAATDAANNAMDSADAAQQAALDAGDKADAALAAVTDLATKVSAIASQIASLSALVKKIAAKVKA